MFLRDREEEVLVLESKEARIKTTLSASVASPRHGGDL